MLNYEAPVANGGYLLSWRYDYDQYYQDYTEVFNSL